MVKSPIVKTSSVVFIATILILGHFLERAEAAQLGQITRSVSARFVNLHSAFFEENNAPEVHHGFREQSLYIPFVISSNLNQSLRVRVELVNSETGRVFALSRFSPNDDFEFFQALDVNVEGNSYGACSCPAGSLPTISTSGELSCRRSNSPLRPEVIHSCPSPKIGQALIDSWVKLAPFNIKDPLLPLMNDNIDVVAASPETLVVKFEVPNHWPSGLHRLNIRIFANTDNSHKAISTNIHILDEKLQAFPRLDVSFWLSEDPRDLTARPANTPIHQHWGGQWWSEEHWSNITTAARKLNEIGVTHSYLPLYQVNPFGHSAKPLVPIKCITKGVIDPSSDPEEYYYQSRYWRYKFDFEGFRKWVRIFRQAGFKRFSGQHLAANGGELPALMFCDLYENENSQTPYRRNFQFMKRSMGENESSYSRLRRRGQYYQKFLPQFLQQLAPTLRHEGLSTLYHQHIIDENAPTSSAQIYYERLVNLVRENLPGIKTIDAINQYTARNYHNSVDNPVAHLALLYDDQLDRGQIRSDFQGFKGRKYFYHTAALNGPNRYLDTNPIENRLIPWLGVELGYTGYIYWASNQFRYPKSPNYLERSAEWSPFTHSLGPLPHGKTHPAHSAGGNWILYPTDTGLIGSLRGLRFREGLIDHWLYYKAYNNCKNKRQPNSCRAHLIDLRLALLGDYRKLSDYSKDVADYDLVRGELIESLYGNN